MAANNNQFYLGYINKLIDEYNNTYHYSVGKKTCYANYSSLTEDIGTNPQAPKFKVGDRVKIIKYKNIFATV